MPPLARSLRENKIGDKGASALAAILKETMISNLECAAAQWCSLLCQRPLARLGTHLCSHARSLRRNGLGTEGGAALAEVIKGNSRLQLLE